jgi:hypothetical protein
LDTSQIKGVVAALAGSTATKYAGAGNIATRAIIGATSTVANNAIDGKPLTDDIGKGAALGAGALTINSNWQINGIGVPSQVYHPGDFNGDGLGDI